MITCHYWSKKLSKSSKDLLKLLIKCQHICCKHNRVKIFIKYAKIGVISQAELTHPIPCRPRSPSMPSKTNDMPEERRRHKSVKQEPAGTARKDKMKPTAPSSTTFLPFTCRLPWGRRWVEGPVQGRGACGSCDSIALAVGRCRPEGRYLTRRFIEWIDLLSS